jgi:hypothetical protein
MEDRSYALPSVAVRRWLVVVLVALSACSGHSQTKADQGRSIAQGAGLPKDVADFFSLAASAASATYRSTLETVDANGQPLQVTTTQRPPDLRVDTFHADGSIDASINVSGRGYQCTQQANHWNCGELGGVAAASDAQVFGPTAVQSAIDRFRQRAIDYDFKVEDRAIVGVTARCLITTRKAGHEQDTALGASATLCISPEGAILRVEVPSGTIAATAYTTTIPDDGFRLPAPVDSAASAAPTTAN